ncbi:MAG: toxin-antitoxin system protein [Sedimenticola sp.]|nr:MAG: toxin-antitoxin system protein [Sedimenticola sp.]
MALTVPINMKAEPAVRSLIDRAAKLLHLNRTEFLLETAIQRAEEVILDHQLISVDEDRFNRFISALEASPVENPRLKELINRKAPWE